jgi:hypothetical protein
MTTQQPSFWCVSNIGDANPFDHGGGFVLVDRTGVYSPHLLMLEAPSGADETLHELHTILLDPLTRIKLKGGIYGLSDNRFHTDDVAWFGDPAQLKSVSDCCGRFDSGLLDSLLSSCPIERAFAYRDVAFYYGPANFDNYPRRLEPEKAELLCNTMLAQIEQSKTWHQGYGVNYNG